jgi:hypothetical protein
VTEAITGINAKDGASCLFWESTKGTVEAADTIFLLIFILYIQSAMLTTLQDTSPSRRESESHYWKKRLGADSGYQAVPFPRNARGLILAARRYGRRTA